MEDRFWSKVARGSDDECWLWQASQRGGNAGNRYGGFAIVPRPIKIDYSHRIAWKLANNAEIPEGMEVMHSCDVRLCCNPRHLSLGTRLDNMRDAAAKRRLRSRGTLTLDQANEIRRLYAAGGVTQRELGQRFGISEKATWRIIAGHSYKVDA